LNFCTNRPIFAAAIALMIVLAGGISMLVPPIAQYPPLVPPQVQVATQYIGASSDVVAKTVTTENRKHKSPPGQCAKAISAPSPRAQHLNFSES